VTSYIPRWFTRPQTVTHPSTNPAVHGRESNSRPVDHKSDALTTAPPSHRYINVRVTDKSMQIVNHKRGMIFRLRVGSKIGEKQSRQSNSKYIFIEYAFFEKGIGLCGVWGLGQSPQKLGSFREFLCYGLQGYF